MDEKQFKDMLNNGSKAFRDKNSSEASRLCSTLKECDTRKALVIPSQGKGKSEDRFEIVFEIYSARPCDWDNYSTKELQDCIVEEGILPDDNWKILQGKVITKKALTKKDEQTIVYVTKL